MEKLRNKGRFAKTPKMEAGRLIRAISGMGGFVTGLQDLDIEILTASEEDLAHWAKKAQEISKALNQFATKLKKGVSDAAKRTEHESDQSHGEGSDGSPDCAAGTASPSG